MARARKAVAAAAPVVTGLAGEVGGGGDGDGGDAPLEVPLPVEVDRKGAPPVEGVPLAVTAGGDDKEKDTKKDVKGEKGVNPVKWLGHYSSAQSIPLVGDGDFSFSLALANAFGSGANLVPTSLDTYEALRNKYRKAESNVAELKRLGATVFHGVDAKEMKLHPDLKNRRFDRIVFNLPHAGFTGKEDDEHMINSHRELVWGFFHNAIHLLRPYCEIHISHKTGRSYDKWGLVDLASGASLVLVDKVAFQLEDYPGYNQKRGDSARCDEPFGLDACFTFKFRIRDLNSRKKLNGNMTSPISSLGIMAPATERGPFHPFSPAESWPHRRHLPPRINAVQKVTTLASYKVVGRQHLDFPLNFDGAVRDLYFDEERDARTMLRTPGPSLQALPDPGVIPPPRGRIPCPDLIAPQEEHWHQHRPTADLPGRHHSYLAEEHQWSPQREREMWGQVLPGSTSSDHSALLEHRHRDRECVEKKEWLRRMVALYGGQ